MKININTKEILTDLPNDVLQVWVLEYLGQPIGKDMYEKAVKTKEKYPQYFSKTKK